MKDICLKRYSQTDEYHVNKITEQDYYQFFKKYSKDKIHLILQKDALVGWGYLSLPKTSLYSGFVLVYVAPGHRRKGIGTYAYRQFENQLKETGCNWWSSYLESEAADRFALSVGYDYTNTNSCLVYSGSGISACTDGIRKCRLEDYPAAPDIWSKEYAAVHIRMGLPYERKALSLDERKQEYNEFCKNINNYFVMEVDKRIVGIGSLFNDNSGIGSLAIDSIWSGRGYGTRLAAFLTNECIRRGCTNPCIYCETGNDNAMHLYKKIGYVEKSRESVAVKN